MARGHVDRVRGEHGKSMSDKWNKDRAKANEKVGMITFRVEIEQIGLYLEGKIGTLEDPNGRFEVYIPKKKKARRQ